MREYRRFNYLKHPHFLRQANKLCTRRDDDKKRVREREEKAEQD